MNDAFSPLGHTGLEALVNDDTSPPGAWLSSPLRDSPSPALPSLPGSPAGFPSPNGATMPLRHAAEDVMRSRFDLHHSPLQPSESQHQHIQNPTVNPTPAGAQEQIQQEQPQKAHEKPSDVPPVDENGELPSNEPTKVCGLCQEALPVSQFRGNNRNTLGTYCVDCNALRSRHKTLRVAQLRDMMSAGQISKADVQAQVVAANPDYTLPGDVSLPGTRECYLCDFPKPITKFPAFGELFVAADPPPPLAQPKRGLCCQKCDAALRKGFHIPIQDLRSAAGAGTLNDFMAIAVPRNPNLSRLAEVTPCGICEGPRPVTELKDVPVDARDMDGKEDGACVPSGNIDPSVGEQGCNGHTAPGDSTSVKACIGCRRILRVWQGSVAELRTAIASGAASVSHANPNNIPKVYRYARGLADTPTITIKVTEASALSQKCGQAFLNALKSRPPVSDIKPRLGPLAAAAVPRTAPLSVTAPLAGAPPHPEPSTGAGSKRSRAMMQEEWDEPVKPQDDDSSGPEGADGTKPCKYEPSVPAETVAMTPQTMLCRQRLKLEAFSRDGTGGCAYCGPCDHFRRISTRHGVTMASLRTLVEMGLGVPYLDEISKRVLHPSRKVTQGTRKQFANCRINFGNACLDQPPKEAEQVLVSAFAGWMPGQPGTSSYRVPLDMDTILAIVYGGEVPAQTAAAPPGVTHPAEVSARPFPDAPAFYNDQPSAKRHNAAAPGVDVEMDIIAAAREAGSGARCSFCERRLALSEFPAEEDGGERRCHDCIALLRCAAQYSMSTTAVRAALHTGTLDLVLPDRPTHKGSVPPAAQRPPVPSAPAPAPAPPKPAPPPTPTRTAEEVFNMYIVPDSEAQGVTQAVQRPANPRQPRLCGLCGEVYRLGFFKWQGGTRWGYCAVCDRLRGRCSRAGVNVATMRSNFERGTIRQVLEDKNVAWDPNVDVPTAADIVEASWAAAAVSMTGDDIPEFLTAVQEGRWGAGVAAIAPSQTGTPGGPVAAVEGTALPAANLLSGPAINMGEAAVRSIPVGPGNGMAPDVGAQAMGPVQTGQLSSFGPVAGAGTMPASHMAPVVAGGHDTVNAAPGARASRGSQVASRPSGSSRGSHKPQRVRTCEVCGEQKSRSAFKSLATENEFVPRDCCSECARICKVVAPMGITWEEVQQAIETGTINQLMEAAGHMAM